MYYLYKFVFDKVHIPDRYHDSFFQINRHTKYTGGSQTVASSTDTKHHYCTKQVVPSAVSIHYKLWDMAPLSGQIRHDNGGRLLLHFRVHRIKIVSDISWRSPFEGLFVALKM